MHLDIYQIDAFTDEVFKGNPAAVVPLKEWLPDETLQNIAFENNLSETAFFVKKENVFHLRWFTPTTDVDLCGHATLASAFLLFNKLGYKGNKIHFTCLSGDLYVTKKQNGYMMDFPVWEYEETPVTDEVIDALGTKPTELYKGKKWIAVFDEERIIRNIAPNMEKVKNIKGCGGILTTAKAKDTDFISRNFAPQKGIPEDPVTGSAHCVLTPFWSKRLNKTKLTAYQASERGGYLLCELKNGRVEITGQACLYMEGKIQI